MCTKCKAALTDLRTFYDNGTVYCWQCYAPMVHSDLRSELWEGSQHRKIEQAAYERALVISGRTQRR